jgi:hypothetical protein
MLITLKSTKLNTDTDTGTVPDCLVQVCLGQLQIFWEFQAGDDKLFHFIIDPATERHVLNEETDHLAGYSVISQYRKPAPDIQPNK